ncbi:unannotated protein [freshwater metagenome]|uniref:Unannotated protein n=1 Tax=freshwater metagenome TaxID=449393 RepID=A0A6J7S7K5_9ZZZZ
MAMNGISGMIRNENMSALAVVAEVGGPTDLAIAGRGSGYAVSGHGGLQRLKLEGKKITK